MQRYFIQDKLSLNERYLMDAENSHHILKVMRGQKGEQFLVVDRDHEVFSCEIIDSDDFKAVVLPIELKEDSAEFDHKVAIACGLSKNDKLEWIVQKATECGMSEFFPLALKRDVMKWPENKQAKRIERLKKIAKEAAEQSHRNVVPVINELKNLNDLIRESEHYDIKLIAYEETAKQGQHQNLKRILKQLQDHQSVLMVFGSEGGLSIDEVEHLESLGFISCSLGPRILRAETAPIYFLSALSYQLEL